MPKIKSNQSTKKEVKDNGDFEQELVIVQSQFEINEVLDDLPDEFHLKWSKKRIDKGAYEITMSKNMDVNSKIKNPQQITYVGHSAVGSNYIALYGVKDTVIINTLKKLLEKYPTINQINILTCFSAVVRGENKLIQERIKKERAGLSFCEYLIVQLKKEFGDNAARLKGLVIMGSLGEVCPSGTGRVTISGSKQKVLSENYLTIDTKTGLVAIDAEKFLASYGLVAKPKMEFSVKTNIAIGNNIFAAPSDESKEEVEEEEIEEKREEKSEEKIVDNQKKNTVDARITN